MRAVAPGGTLATVAGTGVAGFNGEIVSPRAAQLNRPQGVAADALGNWYVADTANNRVRKVQPGGNLFTIAGNGNASYFGDGGPAIKASVNQPEGVAVDAAGNVYIADTLDHAVRKVTPDGVINTLAGTGTPGYSGDGGPANRARLNGPRAVAVDAAGNVYVADTGNNQVRRIDPQGTITTVDTGNALSGPRGVAVDRAGNVYIADTGNRLVRRVSPGAPVTTIAGNGTCCYSGDGALGAGCPVEPAVGLVGGCQRQRLRGRSGEQRGAHARPGIGRHHGERGDQCGEQSGGSDRAGGTGGAVRFRARRARRRCCSTASPAPLLYATPGQVGAVVPYALSGGTVQVVVQGAGAASSPVAVAVAPTAPGVFTVGRFGSRAGGGGQSGRDTQWDGGSGVAGLGAVPVCDRRGTDLAGRRGRETGDGSGAAAGCHGYGDDRRSGGGGPLRGRSSGADRGRNAGERRGARRAVRRGARGDHDGRSGKPARRYGGGAVAPGYSGFGCQRTVRASLGLTG